MVVLWITLIIKKNLQFKKPGYKTAYSKKSIKSPYVYLLLIETNQTSTISVDLPLIKLMSCIPANSAYKIAINSLIKGA